MPRGLILRLDSLCNKQSEIQFYPAFSLNWGTSTTEGGYLFAMGDQFVNISKDGKEKWHVMYELGVRDSPPVTLSIDSGILFLVNQKDKQSKYVKYDAGIAHIDLSGKLYVTKVEKAIMGSKVRMVLADSKVIYSTSIPKKPDIYIQPHVVLSSYDVGELTSHNNIEYLIKKNNHDDLFFGGPELFSYEKVFPKKPLRIAEQPAQINAQKIKLNIKKHSKQKP